MSATETAYRAICLRVWYAISSTDIAYRARLPVRIVLSAYAYASAMPGTNRAYGASRISKQGMLKLRYLPTHLLRGVRYSHAISAYGYATQCPVLKQRIGLCARYATPSTDVARTTRARDQSR
eukprot:3940308-Rhodomonas_salina.3